MVPRRVVRLAAYGLAAALLLSLAGFAHPARAQVRLDARYTAFLAGIPIGRGVWVVDIGEGQFTAAASGRTTGLLRVFAGGRGSVAARGEVIDGRPLPGSFALNIDARKRTDEVRMAIAGGTVREVSAQPPFPPAPDRVPVTEMHRRGVLDPMSAVLVAVPGTGTPVSAQACERTLPIFDGRGRFDLALSFKRIDEVRAEKGYRGPAVVCAVRFRPISGHRPDRPVLKYLMETTDIEVWLTPIAGTRILVPFRVSIPTVIGAAVLEADRFEANGQPPRPAATRTNSPAR